MNLENVPIESPYVSIVPFWMGVWRRLLFSYLISFASLKEKVYLLTIIEHIIDSKSQNFPCSPPLKKQRKKKQLKKMKKSYLYYEASYRLSLAILTKSIQYLHVASK